MSGFISKNATLDVSVSYSYLHDKNAHSSATIFSTNMP